MDWQEEASLDPAYLEWLSRMENTEYEDRDND